MHGCSDWLKTVAHKTVTEQEQMNENKLAEVTAFFGSRLGLVPRIIQCCYT